MELVCAGEKFLIYGKYVSECIKMQIHTLNVSRLKINVLIHVNGSLKRKVEWQFQKGIRHILIAFDKFWSVFCGFDRCKITGLRFLPAKKRPITWNSCKLNLLVFENNEQFSASKIGNTKAKLRIHCLTFKQCGKLRFCDNNVMSGSIEHLHSMHASLWLTLL